MIFRLIGRAWARYNRFLDEKPFTSTLATASVLYAGGDMMCQGMELYFKRKQIQKNIQDGGAEENVEKMKQNMQDTQGLEKSIQIVNSDQLSMDWMRVLRMTLYGTFVFGITSFYWYKWLDEYLAPLSKSIQVVSKVALDEFVYAPFCITTIFGCLSYMEGKSWSMIRQKIQKDFWPTFRVDMIVWPILQTINFYLLPLKFRVLYISVASLFWNVFLSFMHNRSHSSS